MFEFSLKGLKGKEEIFTHVNSPLEFLTTRNFSQLRILDKLNLLCGIHCQWENSHGEILTHRNEFK